MKHLLFGRKSEKTSASSKKSGNSTRPPSNRKRGRQPGVPGNGRNLHNNLPVVHEPVDLPEEEQRYAACHLLFRPFFNSSGCDVIEVEVKAHVRRDFIDAQRGDPELEKWSATWVSRIGHLYHLNDQRLKVLGDPEQFSARQLKLERQVEQMATQRDQEPKRPKLPVRAKWWRSGGC